MGTVTCTLGATALDTSALDALIEDRLAALDLPARVRLLTGSRMWRFAGDPAAGLAEMIVSDGPVGVRGEWLDEREWSACLPCPTALAATWDEALVRRLGGLLAAEARRQGVHVLLAPAVNIQRSPLAGRHFEYFSEDPLLTARIGVAYVRGVQAGGIAAAAKHYVGNEAETERMTVDNLIPADALAELYLASFEALVRDGGVWVVVSAYNGINGTTMSAHDLLTDPLRTRWGFDGLVVSDWTAVRETVAPARAGLDVVMPGPDGPWGAALVRAVESGAVPAESVAVKVRNLLRLAARVGCLDGVPAAVTEPVVVPDHEHRTLLRTAAAAGSVLVRNDGILPLPEQPHLALLGPHAAHPRVQGGGSARTFPRDVVTPLAALADEFVLDHADGVFLDARPSPLTAADLADGLEVVLRAADGTELRREHRHAGWLTWTDGVRPASVEITGRLAVDLTGSWLVALGGVGHYVLTLDDVVVLDTEIDADPDVPWPPYAGHAVPLAAGDSVWFHVQYTPRPGRPDAPSVHVAVRRPRRDPDAELAHAVALAAAADVAVVVVGTTEDIESEGSDRATLALPGRQDELVTRVARVNPRTVVVVNAGAPVLLPWLDEVAACLVTWFPGQEAGAALADVLTGRVEPGGRLPAQWPRCDADAFPVLPTGGRLDYAEGLLVGHRAGGDPLLPFGHGLGYTTWEIDDLRADAGFARVRVRNTGRRTGRHVVQVYRTEPAERETGVVRRLAGFAALTAAPGECAEVTIPLAPAAGTGPFTLAAGSSAADLCCHTVVDAPRQGAQQ